MSDLLEFDSIRKEFGTKQVLTDISLKCIPGDIIGLLGRNGSGKSTLLKIVFGTLHTDHKFIRINNDILDQAFKAKKRIAYLCQDNFLPRNLTVRKIIELYSDDFDADGFPYDEVLMKVNDTMIRNLSGGESRYLEVKLLLCLDTRFLLLDEPFNGISPLHIELVKQMIISKSVKKGIILTDHDYRNVMDVANKYYLLFDGGLKHIKNKEDLLYWGYIPDSGLSG
jgi:lipopolysaccharide export system ATP-binding protein